MSWLDVEDLSFAWKCVSLQQGVEKDKDKNEDGYKEKDKDKDKDISHLWHCCCKLLRQVPVVELHQVKKMIFHGVEVLDK